MPAPISSAGTRERLGARSGTAVGLSGATARGVVGVARRADRAGATKVASASPPAKGGDAVTDWRIAAAKAAAEG